MNSEHTAEKLDIEDQAELAFIKGEYQKALQHYQEVLNAETNREKDKDLLHIESLHYKIALAYHRLGMFPEAVKSCNNYLKDRTLTQDQDNEIAVQGHQLLGRIFRDKGDYDESETCYARLSFLFGDPLCKSEKVAAIKNDVGLLNQLKGDFNTALKQHKESLDIYTDKGITETLDVVDVYEGLACVYIRFEEYELSYKYLQMSLEIRTKLQDKDHIDIANLYDILSEYHIHQSEYEKAHEYCKMSLDIRLQKDCGPLDLARSYTTLAKIFKEESKFQDALKYYNMAIDLYRKQDEWHPLLAEIYNSIGYIQERQNDQESCLENCEKAEKIIMKKLGPNHHFLGSTYLFRAIAYKVQRRFTDSLANFNNSLTIRIATFGEEHLFVASVYNNLGILYYTRNNLSEALKYFQKFLAIKSQ